jgi:hypothetical protein
MYTFVKGVLLVSTPPVQVAVIEYKDSAELTEYTPIECGDTISRSGIDGDWIVDFRIVNNGTSLLTVGVVSALNVTDPFTTDVTQPSSTLLPPGSSVEFTIVFEAISGSNIFGDIAIPTSANMDCTIGVALNDIPPA